MNLFNCFQAMAFYTLVPFGIQWLAVHDQTAWAILAGVGELAGFVALSISLHDDSSK